MPIGSGCERFVETGTALGETLGYVALTGVACASIELAAALNTYNEANFKHAPNVTLLHRDSAQRLPEILDASTDPLLAGWPP